MPSLSRELRRLLENTVVQARRIAEEGAKSALESLAVDETEPFSTMCPSQRDLRLRLRARARLLGDGRDREGKQSIGHLAQACAYEHWHRMLFARFLAENGFLLDPHYHVSLSMADVQERARELGRDWLDLASEFAQRMLLEVFRPGDPVLEVSLPPEKRQQLETKLEQLSTEIFVTDDSLGWVYQFWQKEEKDRVNRSENKIGADELAPVTQLFTDDYMVLFLLHNTLGAWWTARRGAAELDGYEWSYLRLREDGTPAAGNFEAWPKRARDLRVLDPCMGSGHFLTFALPIVVRMRMAEEDLTVSEAIYSTLRDNLCGLELDARCSQIAAFNLALTAWRLAGEVVPLPRLHLACSGLGINPTEIEWVKLAGDDSFVRTTMQRLYELFQKAPTLGSLIDPTRVGDLITARFDQVEPLLERALAQEGLGDEDKELAIAAEGLLAAARILASKFTLVATNVPYLGRGKQHAELSSYCERYHNYAKADIATCLVDRIVRWCAPGGSAALVTPQNWLFLTSYKKFREQLLRDTQWDFVVRLGEHAFESSAAAGAFAALLGLSHGQPPEEHSFAGLDLAEMKTPAEKAQRLSTEAPIRAEQQIQLNNPEARIALEPIDTTSLLSSYADAYWGQGTGDFPRFSRFFWEIDAASPDWAPVQSTVEESCDFGGRELFVLWEQGRGTLMRLADELRRLEGNSGIRPTRGSEAWNRRGVCVTLMRHLRVTRYDGHIFDGNCAALVPRDESLLPAIWAFCSSQEFSKSIRRIDQKLNITNHTLLKVPFDLSYWKALAAEKYPDGLPKPYSADPTQWLFNGSLRQSTRQLQVAVSRLLGYRWPRQSGSRFPDCPELNPNDLVLEHHAVPDGIACLSSVHEHEPAHIRLRALLASAYCQEWSAQRLADLVGDFKTLESWLLTGVFREHCDIFHARPFIWHVWDGRNDGFNALVNYHKLAGPNGQGRRTLERLIYTYLGDWIRTQESQIGKVDGADARLVAAHHLRQQLEAILKGEPPFDIFVRWKPIHQQPIGWEPDLNDGVRLNMRPWLEAKPYKPSRRDACILRETPIKLPFGKDRGKEPPRDPEDFPWFDRSTDRTNDVHLTIAEKQAARDRKARNETA
ncbi:MAG: N-6 DNA methylase [Bryobacteraceae bacterium]